MGVVGFLADGVAVDSNLTILPPLIGVTDSLCWEICESSLRADARLDNSSILSCPFPAVEGLEAACLASTDYS